MHPLSCFISPIWLILLTIAWEANAQPWTLAKEKEGIRVYTRKEAGHTLKSYKGEAVIRAAPEKVFRLLEDVNHTEWWDKDVKEITVLAYQKYKSARYYLMYDLPWPLTDRDLAVDVTTTYDPVTGAGTIVAGPLKGIVPLKDGRIRITRYFQSWTVKPAGDGATHVTLEGYADPAGSIPDWVINATVVGAPFNVIGNVKKILEKK